MDLESEINFKQQLNNKEYFAECFITLTLNNRVASSSFKKSYQYQKCFPFLCLINLYDS